MLAFLQYLGTFPHICHFFAIFLKHVQKSGHFGYRAVGKSDVRKKENQIERKIGLRLDN